MTAVLPGDVACPPGDGTLDVIPDSIAVIDEAGGIVAVNRDWALCVQANGGQPGSLDVNYLSVCDAAADEEPTAAQIAGALRQILAGTRSDFAWCYPSHVLGQERWFSLRAAPVHGPGWRHVVITHHDVTARHLAGDASEDPTELLGAVGAAISVTGLDGNVRQWSDGAELLFGWSALEAVGRPYSALTGVPEHKVIAEAVRRSTVEHGAWEGRLEVCDSEARRFPARVRTRLLLDAAGVPSGMISVVTDDSHRVASERELRGARDYRDAVMQAMPDGLCVLDGAGRLTLVNAAAERMLGWRRGELLGTVLHPTLHAVDADGAPRAIEECSITQALLSGGAVRVADDVFQRRDGTLLPVSFSSAPFTSEAGEHGAVVVFNDLTERKAREQLVRREVDALVWAGRIRDALEHDRFVLYAQPIVDVNTGETVQHELLLRMLGADDEVVAPAAFLPVAEEHGLIRAIDRHVVGLAFGYAAQGHPVELNLSADSVGDPELSAFVRDALEQYGVDPTLVVFEITETALIHNEDAALAFTKGVVELGCGVALDDFGTGYGSFRYLKRLPVDVLKIDREFVRDLDGEQGAASRHVITAVVSLARGMGKKTVAEGVETEAALAAVRELGIDYVQGYLFGRPSPAADVFDRVAVRSR